MPLDKPRINQGAGPDVSYTVQGPVGSRAQNVQRRGNVPEPPTAQAPQRLGPSGRILRWITTQK